MLDVGLPREAQTSSEPPKGALPQPHNCLQQCFRFSQHLLCKAIFTITAQFKAKILKVFLRIIPFQRHKSPLSQELTVFSQLKHWETLESSSYCCFKSLTERHPKNNKQQNINMKRKIKTTKISPALLRQKTAHKRQRRISSPEYHKNKRLCKAK